MINITKMGLTIKMRFCFLIMFVLSVFTVNKLNGQYVGVDLKLRHERMMETILPFGFQAPLKSKNTTKEPEKERFLGKGIYTIGANDNVRVLVNLSYSENLLDKQKTKIPFEVTMTYQNNGGKEEKSSLQVKGTSVDFLLNNDKQVMNGTKEKENVLRAYVFLNGKIKTDLSYKYPLKGEILLNVEYE
ncbi:MAG TPA: hypothetical protein VK590_02445 [Saprospiraceae bacterium]|nr:hypothetical protein [Saprospiraceae bacterium]